MHISIQKTTNPKQKPDFSKLGFGRYFTDHMFLMNYDTEGGWHDPRIVPYAPLELDPASMVLHYGQEIFEGMKAYRAADGRTLLFRPHENFLRLNRSGERLCIPSLDVNFCVEAVSELVRTDADWIPTAEGTSLYIRPFIIATDAMLGVHASHSYLFCVILSPVGAYYTAGLAPVRIFVENDDVRAVPGGTGEAKAGGNYSASIRAQMRAGSKGFAQVLWLDGVERKYIEEVGAMNVFFKIGGEVVTPSLSGSILPGITRKSVIELLEKRGLTVSERRISIDELRDAAASGKLEEAWGTGTAAVISPVGELAWGEDSFVINNNQIGEVSQWLYDTLTAIQWGRVADSWSFEI